MKLTVVRSVRTWASDGRLHFTPSQDRGCTKLILAALHRFALARLHRSPLQPDGPTDCRVAARRACFNLHGYERHRSGAFEHLRCGCGRKKHSRRRSASRCWDGPAPGLSVDNDDDDDAVTHGVFLIERRRGSSSSELSLRCVHPRSCSRGNSRLKPFPQSLS